MYTYWPMNKTPSNIDEAKRGIHSSVSKTGKK